MTKPTKRKRPESEGVGARIVVSEVMLRGAAINYARVAELDPSHPNWRRYWRKLRRAAIGMVAEILEAAGANVPLLASGLPAPEPCPETARTFMNVLQLKPGDTAKIEIDANQFEREPLTIHLPSKLAR